MVAGHSCYPGAPRTTIKKVIGFGNENTELEFSVNLRHQQSLKEVNAHLLNAISLLKDHQDDLIILRSTVEPGATNKVCKEIFNILFYCRIWIYIYFLFSLPSKHI